VVPVDKTGNFDMVYNFLKENWRIAKWVALGAVIFEVKQLSIPWIVGFLYTSIQDTKYFCACIKSYLHRVHALNLVSQCSGNHPIKGNNNFSSRGIMK